MIIKSKRHPDRQNVVQLKHVVLPIDPLWKVEPIDPSMFLTGYTGKITASEPLISAPYIPQEFISHFSEIYPMEMPAEKVPGNIWDEYTYTDDFMSLFSRKQVLQLYGLVESDQELEDHLKSIGL